ncbi:MAG TPA: GyrI-like domain-containing protein [Telmatospirillum sp.]|nr:GyrI-like domain-containing protein [Telmatospirillum sp.]
MMRKIDFKTERKDLYAPSHKAFSLVEVPPMAFLMIDGAGDPNGSNSYMEAIEALYSVSYALKFASKKSLERDYVVGPLEGLWWAADCTAFERNARDEWRWTMMIRQPDGIPNAMVETAIETAREKKSLPALVLPRFETFDEGRSAQILHVGPYCDEAPLLTRLHRDELPRRGLAPVGKHHEIYLSDPRKTTPEKLKTILRQPVRPI